VALLQVPYFAGIDQLSEGSLQISREPVSALQKVGKVVWANCLLTIGKIGYPELFYFLYGGMPILCIDI